MNVYLKKHYIKQAIKMTAILLFAVIPTYYIYNTFKDQRNQFMTSDSLSITFHESSGDKITLKDIVGVTDSVGLSSRAYTFTVKNNLDVPVRYSVKLLEDNDAIIADGCQTARIPMQILKLGYHKNKESNNILNFSDFSDNTIVTDTIKGKQTEEYTVRLWVQKGSLTADNDLHFHGLLQVTEDGIDIASATTRKVS